MQSEKQTFEKLQRKNWLDNDITEECIYLTFGWEMSNLGKSF